MIFGYARCSTADQNTDLQIDSLKAAGCERIFEEHESGKREDRPELTRMLDMVRSGDTVVVWRLDRLARSLNQLVAIGNDFGQRGIELRTLTGIAVDTTTPTGRLVFNMFSALAEFESDLIRERSMAGQAAARSRGVKIGRKPALDGDKLTMAKSLVAAGDMSVAAIAKQLSVSRRTLYRHCKLEGETP